MRVVLATNGLGLGGTEKSVQTHALAFDRDRVEVRVVAVREDGFRRAPLEAAGIQVDCANGDRKRLARLFEGADVIHVTRNGVSEPLVPDARRAAGVEVLVESNVFGAVDGSAAERDFNFHLFPSKMCALRYRRKLRLDGPSFHDRHRVSFWPVDLIGLRAQAPATRQAKSELGLDPDRPVVARVGRADDRKWRNLVIDMIPPLLQLAPEAQVLLVGATPTKLRRLERLGVLDRVLLLPTTADEKRLATFYAAADVFVTAAEIGESHSFAIEEAMCLGVPVVTCSTPWVDNAQVEQVDCGATGYVANHPLSFAEAVADLINDPDRRRRFSDASIEKSDALYDAMRLTRQLEDLYEALLAGQRPPAEWMPPTSEVDAFGEEYQRRSDTQFRPLSAAERREVERARWFERAGWALRAAGSSLHPEGVRYAGAVLKAKVMAR